MTALNLWHSVEKIFRKVISGNLTYIFEMCICFMKISYEEMKKLANKDL